MIYYFRKTFFSIQMYVYSINEKTKERQNGHTLYVSCIVERKSKGT